MIPHYLISNHQFLSLPSVAVNGGCIHFHTHRRWAIQSDKILNLLTLQDGGGRRLLGDEEAGEQLHITLHWKRRKINVS